MSAATRHLAGFTLAALTLALALQLALVYAPFGLQPAAPPALPPAAVGADGLARAHAASGNYWTLYFSSPSPTTRQNRQ